MDKEVIVSINPAPSNACCEVCHKHVSELKAFGKAGNPLFGDFDGAKLVKTFRTLAPVNALYDSLIKRVKNWDGLFETNPELADTLSFYDQLVNTVEASWECRDCIILDDNEEYFKKKHGQ